MAYAFAMPILSGKTQAARGFIQEVLGPRKREYDDLQRRQGSSCLRWTHHTPRWAHVKRQ